jgi:cytochrome P450
MSAPDAGLTRLFHLEPDTLRCPYAIFDELRTEQPVTYAPAIECWVVSRFDDIVHVARRPEIFSSMRPTGPLLARQQRRAFEELAAEDPELAAVVTRVMGRTRVLLNADPPDHARQRKLVNRAFTPPKVKSIEPRPRAWSTGSRSGARSSWCRSSASCCRSRSSPSASVWPAATCRSSRSGPTTSWRPSATTS